MLPTKLRFIWPSGGRGEDFFKSTNQKQELPVAAMFVNGSTQNEQTLQRTFHRCCLLSFASFGQAVSEEKIFLNRPIRNKNCLWRPCLLTDQDEICNLYRGPSRDASYQVSKLTDDGRQVMAKAHIEFGKVSEKEQSRETGNIGYTRRRKTKQKTQHMCWTPLITQTHTNNVNKTCVLLQTTGDKDEPNIVFMWKS